MSSDLTTLFDKSRAEVKGKELEHARQHYFIQAQMRGSDDNSIAGLNINTSGRHDAAFLNQKKRNQATDDMILLAMIDDRLAAIGSAMAAKYGEDFAENIAAEYLDEETYKKLMEIEDPEERRRAIAKAINDGIEDGSIDPNKINDNPDIKDWLDVHAERDEHKLESAAIGKATNNDLGIDSAEEAELDSLLSTKNDGFNFS